MKIEYITEETIDGFNEFKKTKRIVLLYILFFISLFLFFLIITKLASDPAYVETSGVLVTILLYYGIFGVAGITLYRANLLDKWRDEILEFYDDFYHEIVKEKEFFGRNNKTKELNFIQKIEREYSENKWRQETASL